VCVCDVSPPFRFGTLGEVALSIFFSASGQRVEMVVSIQSPNDINTVKKTRSKTAGRRMRSRTRVNFTHIN
jgi:hypothetical protein